MVMRCSQESMRVWGDHSVNCLQCKHKDLGSNPKTCVKKLAMTMLACSPRTEEAETGEYLGLTDQPA